MHIILKMAVCSTIKAKILDLDNPKTPEVFKKVLG